MDFLSFLTQMGDFLEMLILEISVWQLAFLTCSLLVLGAYPRKFGCFKFSSGVGKWMRAILRLYLDLRELAQQLTELERSDCVNAG